MLQDNSTPDAEHQTPEPTLPPGSQLDTDLKVIRLLGAGGQGEVYEVSQAGTGLRFAAKVLPPQIGRESKLIKRLQHEAEAVKAIAHPNVIRVFEFKRSSGGRYYLLMELLAGRALSEQMKLGPMPIPLAINIATQIAKGIAAVHEKGIVHRDLKPDNVFLIDGANGVLAKVMDFGIAKADQEWQLTKLTGTGLIVGTPAYIAPEQALTPEEIDHRVDIYTLGLILFEMLTGQRAFQARTIAKLLIQQIQAKPPDLSTLRPDVPPKLKGIVDIALEKQPEARFATMNDLLEQLGRAQAPNAPGRVRTTPRTQERARPANAPLPLPSHQPQPARARWRVAVFFMGSILLGAAGWVAWSQWGPDQDAPVVSVATPASLRAAPVQPLVPAVQKTKRPQKTSPITRTARLLVRSSPSGAAVFLDGRRLRHKDGRFRATPTELDSLKEGEAYVLKLTKAGYRPSVKRLVFSSELQRVSLELKPERSVPLPAPAAPAAPTVSFARLNKQLNGRLRSLGLSKRDLSLIAPKLGPRWLGQWKARDRRLPQLHAELMKRLVREEVDQALLWGKLDRVRKRLLRVARTERRSQAFKRFDQRYVDLQSATHRVQGPYDVALARRITVLETEIDATFPGR